MRHLRGVIVIGSRLSLPRLTKGRRLDWISAGVIVLTLVLLSQRDAVGWLIAYPGDWAVPLTPWFNDFMTWCVGVFGPVFRAISAALEVPMDAVRALLHWLPWSVTLTLLTFATFAVSGWRLAAFTFFAILYMVVIGYWGESMNSLALVAISVPTAVAIGFGLGTLSFYSKRAERIIAPTLDLMQTVPAFAYLLPILLLFGFGPVVGLIASVLYAFPPTVRNTHLGLSRVPPEIVEAGLMAGATPIQLFWRVRVPSASRQILLGVNQTTMAAFSMVIIAAIIGGTADIGWEVLSTMRKAQFGESLLAGIVIALMAMVMDRITAAAAAKEKQDPGGRKPLLARHRNLLIAAGLGLIVGVLSQFFLDSGGIPESLGILSRPVPERRGTVACRRARQDHHIAQELGIFLRHVARKDWARAHNHPLHLGLRVHGDAKDRLRGPRRRPDRLDGGAPGARVGHFGRLSCDHAVLRGHAHAMAGGAGDGDAAWLEAGRPPPGTGHHGGTGIPDRRRCLGHRRCCRSTCAGSRCCSRSESGPWSASSPPSSTAFRPSCGRSTTRCKPCHCS